jgi:amino acid adenylation domain-containing protein
VHEAVEAQVDRTPDAVAVTCRGDSLTYRELDERANRVAADLVGRGIGPDRTVGVCVDRSLDMVVGLLGILKAGGAYVPLEPSYPGERIVMMLEDARPSVLLTVDRLRAALPPVAAQVVTLDAIGRDRMPQRLRTPAAPEHLAYVIFTSGSTGRPKGVLVEHRNVLNCFSGIDRVLGTAPGVWLALSGISFDISVLELFWTLARGFRVVIQEVAERPVSGPSSEVPSARLQPFFDFSLRAQVRRHQVTHLQCTPSQLERFALEEGGLEALAGLRHLLVGGEPLPAALVELIGPHLRGTLHNMYGPTETTIWSTAAVITDGQPITIGRPIANTTVHIRDRALRAMPLGATGELLIGGAGVSRGYLDRPELTGQRFVRDPDTGERLYRTGDLAAWRPDGQLAFLGRMDYQVKIRGHRVELEEIDSVLGEHPSVRESVTVAQPGPSGNVRLVAYVVSRAVENLPPDAGTSSGGEQLPVSESAKDLATALRQYAQRRLPAFMVPSAVVLLSAMPMTPNGKADRRLLSSRETARPTALARVPENDRERVILAVMRELVGRDIGVDDNFVDAGVHSLLLLQASGRLAARLGRPVALGDVFRHPTARALAVALAGADADMAALEKSQSRARQRQDAIRRRRGGPHPE